MDDQAEIIKKAREGDLDAFTELMGTYKKLVYNLCFRMLGDRNEAEDASQEAFIKIFKMLKAYNFSSKFSTWSLKIASNTCIDVIRKRKMQTVPIEDYELDSVTVKGGTSLSEDSPEKSYISLETRKEIEKVVKSLPEKYRIIVIYYHFMNLSYQEISDILNEPMTIVKNRLYRARLMLKDSLLKKEGGSSGLQDSI